jgi:predicted AlkP superfamily pyrophosphatase or phosphodiesterase
LNRTLVLLVVGLTPRLVGENTPNINRVISRGGIRPLQTVTPAVTCTVQSTFTTGTPPGAHGCIANGWYVRELGDILFWHQSDRLVQGEKIWEAGKRRDSGFTCAKLFWWYNMYSAADWSVTPRPQYLADGRKLPDIYTDPPELRDELSARLGTFPLFQFWGPGAGLASSDWIARCALEVMDRRQPTLTLVYLPHLDYGLQKLGPGDAAIGGEVRAVDALCGELIEQADRAGMRIVILSEYGVTQVTGPVYPNRALREAGLLRLRVERETELLDAGASEAFALCDHQIAHVYVRNPANVGPVRRLLEALDGVERVLDAEGKRDCGLDHPRSGDLVAIARADRWFCYYHWLDDARAMDFARTVEIHRKPGYDPAELFFDPALRLPKLAVGWRLARRALGFRALMDVIPLDATLVKGSHGRITSAPEAGPLFASSEAQLLPAGPVAATQVKELILEHVFARSGAGHVAL